MTRIVCFGPGPRFKGGISNYNTALAKALNRMPDTEVYIVSWTQQYPAIIPREFVDKSSKVDLLEGSDIGVYYETNYNSPFSWRETYHLILGLEPDIVIFQWAIAIQGVPMGRIAKQFKRHPEIEVIFDLHFVVQKEGSTLDSILTRYGIKWADTYITHAYRTVDELRALLSKRSFTVTETGERSLHSKSTPVIKLFHPIYDLFQPDPGFDRIGAKREMGLRKHVFLFFGFIRKYKGLHHCIEAFRILSERRNDVSLLICGESFWKTLDEKKLSTRVKRTLFKVAKGLFLKRRHDEGDYRPLSLIDKYDLNDKVVVRNTFIPNEDVHKYFQVSDAVLLFYEYATPSGVESLSYNFKLPIVATRVGHFPETITEGFNGYLAEPDDHVSMADQMERVINEPISPENVDKTTRQMSWENYAKAILNRG